MTCISYRRLLSETCCRNNKKGGVGCSNRRGKSLIAKNSNTVPSSPCLRRLSCFLGRDEKYCVNAGCLHLAYLDTFGNGTIRQSPSFVKFPPYFKINWFSVQCNENSPVSGLRLSLQALGLIRSFLFKPTIFHR